MSENMQSFLLYVMLPGILIGDAFGIALRTLRPEWCRAYAIGCLKIKWWVYCLGALMFGSLALSNYMGGNVPQAAFHSVMTLLQLGSAIFAVRRQL